MVFSALQLPTLTPRDQKQDYEGYLEMMKATEDSRRELGEAKMDTLSALIDKIPGLRSLQTKTTNLVESMLEGNLLDPQISAQMGAAQAGYHGVGGSGAGAMVGTLQWGKDVARTKVQGLSMVPNIINTLAQTFGGNVMRDPEVMGGPRWGAWQSQLEASTRDVYESEVAQAKATHQAAQLNEQYAMQEASRRAAQARMDASAAASRAHSLKIMGSQQAFQIFQQNALNTGFNSPAKVRQREQSALRENRFRGSQRAGRMQGVGYNQWRESSRWG